MPARNRIASLPARRPRRVVAALAALAWGLSGWSPAPVVAGPPEPAQGPTIEILFTYGSEKKDWITAVTDRFNKQGVTIASGERIVVVHEGAGSNVIVSEALDGSKKPHLISPASKVFLDEANGRSIEDGKDPLVDASDTKDLVRSPLVIAIWRDIAEAMGWPGKPISWHEFYGYVSNPKEWDEIRKPKWGRFKFGHTHPDFSNSGILALLTEVYAAKGDFQPENIARGDFQQPELINYVRGIEAATVHYGESTGFFAEKMFANGRSYLTAAVLYENLVYAENKKKVKGDADQPEIVALYPAEGTFPNEHPVGVVKRPWVTARHREAAEAYIRHLLDRPQQEEALKYGFRPVDPAIAIDGVLLPKYGVDHAMFSPDKVLKSPSYTIIKLARKLWRENKRPAQVVLAIDTSRSMEKDDKIKKAEAAAKQFVDKLSSNDSLAVIFFNDDASRPQTFRMDPAGKKAATEEINDLIPDGATALYEAIERGFKHLEVIDRKFNRSLVVLSDGKDTQGLKEKDKPIERPFEHVLKMIESDGESNIYIFTIGYGNGADLDPESLKKIAEKTRAKYFPADPAKIQNILREIVTFF